MTALFKVLAFADRRDNLMLLQWTSRQGVADSRHLLRWSCPNQCDNTEATTERQISSCDLQTRWHLLCVP